MKIYKLADGKPNRNHDLCDFLMRTSRNIQDEYSRINRKTKEDPGTAGDQGEENWKEVLEKWLPSYFQIVTKGRIIDSRGNTSPQIDVLVLSPDYPPQMVGCKEYLAGGVVAAFECKNTLRKEHIDKLFATSKIVKQMGMNKSGTPFRDLNSSIYYGLLAHSHAWKKDNSKPEENIRKALEENCNQIIEHPIQLPDIICVADLMSWSVSKMIVPKQEECGDFSESAVWSTYFQPDDGQETYTAVGSMVFNVLNRLSWDYPSMRNIVTYMKELNISGNGLGEMKKWGMEVLSNASIEGGFVNNNQWDERNMVV